MTKARLTIASLLPALQDQTARPKRMKQSWDIQVAGRARGPWRVVAGMVVLTMTMAIKLTTNRLMDTKETRQESGRPE
jgi:hypothetical protein